MKRIAEALIAWAMMNTPSQFIGGRHDPYLVRWEFFKSWWLSIYVHEFRRSDDDRAEHDHPAPYLTYVAANGYFEHRKGVRRWIEPGTWAFRLNPWAPHRVELAGKAPFIVPAWTIFIRGPNIRFSRWGFHCQKGWVHWRDFTSPTDSSTIGKGCD